MSIKTNTTSLQDLLERVNALPKAVDIDEELNTQDSLIEQIQTVLAGKASGANNDEVDSLITGDFSSYTNSRVTSIRDYCFYTMSNINSVDFPNVTTINSNAFYYCSNLATISFPKVSTISDYAFYNCNFSTISFPACRVIGNGAFYYCPNLTTISFPSCVTVSNSAFFTCSKLVSASFPICTSIGSSAFGYCSSLTTVSFPKAVTIRNYAFTNCSKLASAYFPNATSIGSYAFYKCGRLSSVNIDSATIIYPYAFYSTYFRSINMPLVTSIGSHGFENCWLESVNAPKLQYIDQSAFYGDTGIQFANLPLISYIGASAFVWCISLSEITLGASRVCTLANSNAFSSTPYTGYSSAFSGTPRIYVPASLVNSYKTATNWTYFSSYISAIKNLITFTINGVEHQAEDGMTWGQWFTSEYNTTSYTPNMTITKAPDENAPDLGGPIIQIVQLSDKIIANESYTI